MNTYIYIWHFDAIFKIIKNINYLDLNITFIINYKNKIVKQLIIIDYIFYIIAFIFS
jgi:hypothetical protein